MPLQGRLESQQAVVAGNVDAVAGINLMELIKAGKLHPLATTGVGVLPSSRSTRAWIVMRLCSYR